MSATKTPTEFPGLWVCFRSALVGLFVLVLVVDTLPSVFPVHSRLQDLVEPVLDATGLWQGRWELFAPDPASINTAVSADIKFADGTLAFWTSPNPKTWSLWQKFRNFRWNEYYSTIWQKNYEAGLPALADWIARNFDTENNPVTRVRLYRSWALLEEETFAAEDPFPFSQRRMIFRKEYAQP